MIPRLELSQVERCDQDGLASALDGAQTVVNLIGILNETGRRDYHSTHVEVVRHLVAAAGRVGVSHYAQMSTLGAEASAPSAYQRTKYEGEQVARAEARCPVSVFRPAPFFGPRDRLFYRFARILHAVPLGVLPLACPDARLAPVYVGDVVEAITRVLLDPRVHGGTYELCGPRAYRLEELVRFTAQSMHRPVQIIRLGERLSHLQAEIFQWLPGKPLTPDNLRMLEVDGVCDRDGLAELGIVAQDPRVLVPTFLA